MSLLSILTLSHDWFDRLRSGTSHSSEYDIGYQSIPSNTLTYRIFEALQAKNCLELLTWVTPKYQYFQLFSRCVSDPTLIFLLEIQDIKTHLLIQDHPSLKHLEPSVSMDHTVTDQQNRHQNDPQMIPKSFSNKEIDFRFGIST